MSSSLTSYVVPIEGVMYYLLLYFSFWERIFSLCYRFVNIEDRFMHSENIITVFALFFFSLYLLKTFTVVLVTIYVNVAMVVNMIITVRS